ncbi:hypothetical protein [Streptomyces sp. NPDC014734]|uniref:hypothetical protein n=1 Tax=Streptomyces sp. NPDC014734 TaxID=3364886 RepID=UPI0036F780B1
MMNPQLEAAHASVPAIAQFHERKARVAELLRSLPPVDSPDVEAKRVVDEAVAEFLESGTWPADVEERASAAYARASGARAVRTQVSELNRQYADRSALTSLREAYRSEILGALGEQLADLLAEARKHVPALGDARTADEALSAGKAVAEAYTTLRPLVADLANIRAAQWIALSQGELTGPGSLYERARTSGHGDVQGVNDDTPARQFDVMRHHAYDMDHLVWLAQIGTAYVPESIDEVIEAEDAYRSRGIVPDHRPVTDLSPRASTIRPVPQPNRDKRGTAERERIARARSGRSY